MIRTNIAREPHIFVIFQGEGQAPLSPSRSTHDSVINTGFLALLVFSYEFQRAKDKCLTLLFVLSAERF